MTGPEHYREAERLLELAQENPTFGTGIAAAEQAKVHATLALAAATAAAIPTEGNEPIVEDWFRVAGAW